ncbi:flagellar assembly protein FliH [Fervidibacillus halotolerans]|uniref:Flagellar assembly protein FliH n=1 Tax=Fervidibacillus halotolerans TaxID=2980027 RepID=A0A9E8RYA3_9BACI|nr:flagellar assembly protein FliH [Fervidibacillus halotolerans]WAA13605.1 flagellar assembly protein FliH [Fervidibacillus halotolerans]
MSKLIKNGFAGKAEEKVITIRLFPSTPAEREKEEIQEQNFSQHLEEAQKTAQNIIEEAKIKALRIENEMKTLKENMEKKRRQIFDQAKKKGYNDGFVQGKEIGYSEMEKHIQLAKQIAIDAKNEYDQAIERAEQMILSIALKAAEKIVKTSLADKKEMFLPIVKEAIEEAKHSKEIQVYVHPKYYSTLLDRKDEIFSNIPIDYQIFFHPKDELAETACLIEMEGGFIDAGIDSQFQQLAEKLYERLAGTNS